MKAFWMVAIALTASTAELSAGTVSIDTIQPAGHSIRASVSQTAFGHDFADTVSAEATSLAADARFAGISKIHAMSVTVAQTPEPATMGLLGLGLTLISIIGRRKLRGSRQGTQAN
jgi:hypothetical protein